jgi:hypothetical protein
VVPLLGHYIFMLSPLGHTANPLSSWLKLLTAVDLEAGLECSRVGLELQFVAVRVVAVSLSVLFEDPQTQLRIEILARDHGAAMSTKRGSFSVSESPATQPFSF